jgi:Icc-related predicted phosphoesterase
VLQCFFASDLHGKVDRYESLFECIDRERPGAVFLGGDLLPHYMDQSWALDFDHQDFVQDIIVAGFRRLKASLGPEYPQVFLILGNDDPRLEEAAVLSAAAQGYWHYMHNRRARLGHRPVYGYACVPPTPFQLKDWERYDVSRFVDPGAVSPEEGRRSIPVPERQIRYGTIKEDLELLAGQDDLAPAIFLFHAPPHRTRLDRAALDGKMVDHVPLDVHIGSIAIRRFIEERRPWITLHGHVHESARLTGAWSDRLGRTHLFSGAHDGSELALVRFDADDPSRASRSLIPCGSSSDAGS